MKHSADGLTTPAAPSARPPLLQEGNTPTFQVIPISTARYRPTDNFSSVQSRSDLIGFPGSKSFDPPKPSQLSCFTISKTILESRI